MTPGRLTQAERRARTRAALLEAAARGISRYGYANLVLERVAREAGYSRGALYHHFANKEDLALAVVKWVEETWYQDVGHRFADKADPVRTLLAVAGGHSDYLRRREVTGVIVALRAEFGGSDHPVGEAVDALVGRVVDDATRLIAAARRRRAIPPGPPPRTLALGFVGVIEGLGIHLSGEPDDVQLTERAARGVLGLTPPPESPSSA